jgi:hypothetical protein
MIESVAGFKAAPEAAKRERKTNIYKRFFLYLLLLRKEGVGCGESLSGTSNIKEIVGQLVVVPQL